MCDHPKMFLRFQKGREFTEKGKKLSESFQKAGGIKDSGECGVWSDTEWHKVRTIIKLMQAVMPFVLSQLLHYRLIFHGNIIQKLALIPFL